MYELLGVMFTSFILNIIPFAGPSNMLIASNVALTLKTDPITTGFVVALGSAFAKSIHYVITFFAGGFLGKKRRERLDAIGLKIKHWAFFALFAVATTPLPDEPIVIPLGLLKYNPLKFFAAYFLGKLVIAIVGAYFGLVAGERFAPIFGEEILVIASIILTIILTALLLKVDINEIAKKFIEKFRGWRSK